MKKIFIFIFLFSLLLFTSCRKKDSIPDFNLPETINIFTGNEELLNLPSYFSDKQVNIDVDNTSVVKVDNRKLVGLKDGNTSLTVTYEGKSQTIKVVVSTPELEGIFLESFSMTIRVGESKKIQLETEPSDYNFDLNYSVKNTGIASIENNVVTGLKVGTTKIVVSYGDIKEEIDLEVTTPLFTGFEVTEEEVNILCYESRTLSFKTLPVGYVYQCNYRSTNESIVKMNGKNVIGVGVGECDVIISCNNIETKVHVKVGIPNSTSIETEFNEYSLFEDENIDFNYEVLPKFTLQDADVSFDRDGIVVIENGKIKPLKTGVVMATLKAKDDGQAETTFKIKVKSHNTDSDTVAPEIVFSEGKDGSYKLNWGKDLNPLDGVSVIDDVSGDITNDLKVISSNVNNLKYGTYSVIYEVSDDNNNTATVTRKVEVIWDYNITFIGHGGSYYGVMNTYDAFKYALEELQYQAVECDLKITKDGVFVLCHEDEFAGLSIGQTNYSDLKDVVRTSTRDTGYPGQYGLIGDGKYSSKICTLADYLDLCKEFNAKAVIELKGCAGIYQSDTSNMGKLLKEIEDHEMLDSVIFLASQYNCLIWVKENGYDYIPCQYLVNTCESQDVLNRCLQYGFELSVNVTGDYRNSDFWIKKYQDNGIKISTWTFSQYVNYNVVQEWIDKGVDYVTCDWHPMTKLDLSNREN